MSITNARVAPSRDPPPPPGGGTPVILAVLVPNGESCCLCHYLQPGTRQSLTAGIEVPERPLGNEGVSTKRTIVTRFPLECLASCQSTNASQLLQNPGKGAGISHWAWPGLAAASKLQRGGPTLRASERLTPLYTDCANLAILPLIESHADGLLQIWLHLQHSS